MISEPSTVTPPLKRPYIFLGRCVIKVGVPTSPRGHMNVEAPRPHLRDLQHNGKPLDPMPCVLQRDPGQRIYIYIHYIYIHYIYIHYIYTLYIYIIYIYQIHIWVVILNIFYFHTLFNYLGKIPIWSRRFTIFDHRLNSCAQKVYRLQRFAGRFWTIWLAFGEWDNESPLINVKLHSLKQYFENGNQFWR